MRKVIAIPIVAGLLGFAGLAAPLAAHASTADTPVTFSLAGGSLSIQEPTTATIGATVGGEPAVADLGAVTVADETGNASGGWTATAVASDFTGENTDTVIPSSDVKYDSGTISGDTSVGTFTSSGSVNIGAPVGEAPAATVVQASDEAGNATVSWDPTITITLPSSGQVADTYDGTVTESVA
jgi:hypothetical protein